ncbi:MAG: ADP-ribosylglycohydrolase family protein [Muribaculaceae bacterium]|nr:ADP-ribosylglycohydrolase family protein [Muribaculaceae bacterium]
MIGSIAGDIIGSKYEFANIKIKEFPLFGEDHGFTDDSVLTVATADWILNGGDLAHIYQQYAMNNPHPMGGYGPIFCRWVVRASRLGDFSAYGSCGNGSAMRISPVGWAFDTEEEVLAKAKESAECTHNHPEGIIGAQATALAIFMARKGASAEDIRKAITDRFGYDLSMTVDEIRPRYSWAGLDGIVSGATCQGSVPQAIICALEATDYEDAVRNAVSIGGDSDTIACITGSIAEAMFGVPDEIRKSAMEYLPDDFVKVVTTFESRYGKK